MEHNYLKEKVRHMLTIFKREREFQEEVIVLIKIYKLGEVGITSE